MTDVMVMDEESTLPKESSPCMAKLNRVEWASCEWFEIDGYRFGVRATSAAFAGWIRYVLARYRADGPSEPDQDPLFSVVVDDEATGTARAGKRLQILYEGTADIVRTMDVRAVARSFLHELEAITFPTRDDAMYLEGSIMQGERGYVLIPWMMVPPINTAARQIRRSVDLVLPATVSVALDHETGHLRPITRTLDIPGDALDALDGFVPVGADEDVRSTVSEDTPIERVVVLGGDRWEPVLRPVSGRAAALFTLARSVRNLAALKGRGLDALGRVVAQTEVVETRWTDRQDLVAVVSAAVSGGYVGEAREAEPA